MTEKEIAEIREKAEAGDAEAQWKMGLLYLSKIAAAKSLTPQEKAIDWYTLAATNGESMGALGLGSIYSSGKVAPRDAVKSVYWFQKSVELSKAQGKPNYYFDNRLAGAQAGGSGSDESQLYIGVCYLYGWGVPQDEKAAKKWLRKSASLGNADAMKLLKEHFNIKNVKQIEPHDPD